MALSMAVDFKGIHIPNAYIKIASYRGDKDVLAFTVSVHSSIEHEALDVKNYDCTLDLEAGNPVKQGYEYLKTLPFYSSAVDC
jgi:hypothetical protein